ncbi:hypothetical protein [Streptomyces sp. 6N223]|uniref:hypothetical protein n=1 Tax=Streptomyces sp. 6N223 TaxID=3457412 RepID=UPI003FD53241
MTEWVPTFDYPASEEWLLLDVNLPDGAERVAQQVADRGGRHNKRYARGVRELMKHNWDGSSELRVGPVVVYVPPVPSNALPLSPASVNALREVPDHDRTLETVVRHAREAAAEAEADPTRRREITTVELPAGPACRIHDAPVPNPGHEGEPARWEMLYHLLLTEECPKEILVLDATWVSGAVPGMAELADRMAATLRFVPGDSGQGPHPVLASPQAPIVFDEVQIGKGLRPLAQHGFVTIDRDEDVLTLLDSNRRPIDSAPLAKVEASKRGITGGMTVSLALNGTKYSVSPGWGARRPAPIPGLGNPVKDAADTLMRLIEHGGGSTR